MTNIVGFISVLIGIAVMPATEIKPGMKGTGYSVFSGTKPEPFEVEIIDVIFQAFPRGDLILARLAGAGLEKTGVIAGMSGSPVYIDGKLIGAVAYAWDFAKEPIAGITPAEEMLKIWALPDSGKGKTPGRAAPAERTTFPLPPIPLAISGLNKRLEQVVVPRLKELGFQPIAAGVAGNDIDTADLVPGGVVGVAIIDGDVRMAALGTITHREGNRILAFGHPLFQAGTVQLPLTGGKIHTVLPSLEISYKMFSPTSPVGIITQDRSTGISGLIGPRAPMIPVNVHLRSTATDDTYRFRMAVQEQLTPEFLPIGLANVILASEGLMEEYTVETRMRLTLQTGTGESTTAEVKHTFIGPDPLIKMLEKLRAELKLLYENSLQPVEIRSIATTIQLLPGRNSAELIAARPLRNRVRAGDTVPVLLRLQTYRGEESETRINIPIPPTTPKGKINITISSRDDFLAAEAGRAGRTLKPASFSKLLQLLAESGREDELIVAGFLPRTGLVLIDRELSQPPPSLRAVLTARRSGGEIEPTGTSLLFKLAVPMNRVVLGALNLELEVE